MQKNIKKAAIVYNNTENFKTKWRLTTATSNLQSDQVSFRSVSMHELGHYLGLNEEYKNTNSIMSSTMIAGTCPTIASSDYSWLLELINRADIISTDPADNEITFNPPPGTYASPIFFNPTTNLDGKIYYTKSYTEEGRKSNPVTLTQGILVDASTDWMRSYGEGDWYIDAVVINDKHTEIISKHYLAHYHIDKTTGIEDGITFYPTTYQNPTVIVQNGTYDYEWAFFDAAPEGDLLNPETISVKFYVQSTLGEVALPFTVQNTLPYPKHRYVIGQLPEGYCWQRDENGNIYARLEVRGNDYDGITHVGVYQLGVSGGPSVTTSGTLPNNEYWGNYIYIYGDVTIPAGKTLTILPNTTIYFNNNSSLVVNGTLNANGATFDFVSANSTYSNGIKLLPGSIASISNSTIKNAYQGINLNHAYLSMSGCNITGCSSHGIYMYDEGSVADRSVITNSSIHDNTGTGIVLYYSSPIIKENNIYNNYYGIGMGDYSAPSLGYMGAHGYNHIFTNRSHGFSANRESYPFLGENICIENGGHNRIENNSYKNVSVYGNSIVTAENNWWEYLSDNETINTSKFLVSSGSFDYYPPADPTDPARIFDMAQSPNPSLISNQPAAKSSPEELLYDSKFATVTSTASNEVINPNQIARIGNDSLQSSSEVIAPQGFDDKWPLLKKLTYARYLLVLNRAAESEEICKNIVETFPDSSISYYGLDILWQNGRKNRMEDFKNYLKLLKSNLDKKPVSLMAEVIESRFDKVNRIKLLDELSSKINNGSSKDLSSRARKDILESILFSKLLHYLNDEKNMDKAKETVLEIDNLAGFRSHSSVEAHSLIGDDIPEKDMLAKDLKESEESASLEKPTEYSLSDNYPNPFNPSTRIDYTLPMTSKVELKVYDILGHEIATLVNSVKEAGRYSAMFDASKLSSGLYIYKIRSQSLENGRVFERTAKMMYLK